MYISTDVDLSKSFGVEVQYQVPLYQRRYIWNEANWERLWRDILAQLGLELIEDSGGKFVCKKPEQSEDTPNLTLDEENDRGHFTGIIVRRPIIHEESLERFEVIDGQQRLITFQIICCVIRDIFKSVNYDDEANDPNQLIANKPAVAKRYSDAVYKFMPTEYDKEEFEVIAKGEYGELIPKAFDETSSSLDSDKLSEIISGISLNSEDLSNNVLKVYNYFYRWIRIYMEKDFDYDKLDDLLDIIKTRFTFAIISLDRGDKSEEIFESLNATGQMLLEFDYLRNNLFLRARNLGVEDGKLGEPYSDIFYSRYWHFDSKENRSYWTTEKLNEFFRVFLKAKLGPNCFDPKNVKPYEVYRRYSKGLTEGIEYEFEQLSNYAGSYKEMESSWSVTSRYMQFCDYLDLLRLDSLILFGKHGAGLEVEKIRDVCDILESYIVRCMLCSREKQTFITEINTFFSEAVKCSSKFNPTKFKEHLSDSCPKNTVVKTAFEGAKLKDPKLILYILYRIEIKLRENFQQDLEFKNLLLLTIKDQEYPDSPVFTDSGQLVWWKPELDSIGNMTFCTERPPDNWSILSFDKRKKFINDNSEKFSYAGQQAASSSAWNEKKIDEITEILHREFCSIWETL